MSDTTLTYLDSYCERAGNPDFWAEPLNAITNIAFLIAAYVIWRKLPGFSRRNVDIYLLTITLFAIGIGSGLWHTQATLHTMLADVIPIALFMNVYLVAAIRRLFGFAWWKVAGLWALYTAVGVVAQKTLPPDTLNGTIMYIPTYATLILLALGLKLRGDTATARIFWQVLAVWTVSLLFRTIDISVCGQFSIGTHFLWHLLNAWVLWRLLRALYERPA